MAALGMETSAGDFEVIDLCFAGLPDLVKSPSVTDGKSSGASNGDAKGKGKAQANGTHLLPACQSTKQSNAADMRQARMMTLPRRRRHGWRWSRAFLSARKKRRRTSRLKCW